jgi:hypothetical protein
MKMQKSQIRLSENHPSMLLALESQSVLAAPLVIDQEGMLIDGYRRFQLSADEEVETIQMNVSDPFEAALALNQRTRRWDDADCFLWTRWARALNRINTNLPISHFTQLLFEADVSLLQHIAARQLSLRQAQLILNSPNRYRFFLQDFLTDKIQLNANETSAFIDMACDLANKLGKPRLEDLFAGDPFSSILAGALTPRQKGEALLKVMRDLRYPYYQQRAHEFSLVWRELNLGESIQARKSLFLERGVLELTLTSTSVEELNRIAIQLCRSLESPVWSRIWNE